MRDAVVIDTFIDDTYQNLVDANSASISYGNQPLAVSQDGRSLIFSVSSSRSVSANASRVFVRGKVKLQAVTGKPLIAKGKLPSYPGYAEKIGPFITSLRSITVDPNESAMSLTIGARGRSDRILKVRILDAKNPSIVLSDSKQITFSDMSPSPGPGDTYRPNTIHARLNTVTTNSMTIEYTYAEQTEQIIVPFEAQIDTGWIKAGPVTIPVPTQNTGMMIPTSRQWPPLAQPATNDPIPKPRSPFLPDNTRLKEPAKK